MSLKASEKPRTSSGEVHTLLRAIDYSATTEGWLDAPRVVADAIDWAVQAEALRRNRTLGEMQRELVLRLRQTVPVPSIEAYVRRTR